jgi:aminoglycoside phosphotransferase (APT) family kinase protein
VFEGLAPIEMRDAHARGLEHVPPDEPSVLLHGDLLGQNILLAVDAPASRDRLGVRDAR